MSETASTGESTTGPAETGTVTAPETKSADWYEGQISQLRQEAASNRVKGKEKADAARAEVKTEFEAKLAESNTAHEATKAELATVSLNNSKLTTALEAVLGADVAKKVAAFASTVQGSTEDELKAHAAELQKLFGLNVEQTSQQATDPSQGLGGGKSSDGDFGSWMTSKFGY